jgi:hypothetical protein
LKSVGSIVSRALGFITFLGFFTLIFSLNHVYLLPLKEDPVYSGLWGQTMLYGTLGLFVVISVIMALSAALGLQFAFLRLFSLRWALHGGAVSASGTFVSLRPRLLGMLDKIGRVTQKALVLMTPPIIPLILKAVAKLFKFPRVFRSVSQGIGSSGKKTAGILMEGAQKTAGAADKGAQALARIFKDASFSASRFIKGIRARFEAPKRLPLLQKPLLEPPALDKHETPVLLQEKKWIRHAYRQLRSAEMAGDATAAQNSKADLSVFGFYELPEREAKLLVSDIDMEFKRKRRRRVKMFASN